MLDVVLLGLLCGLVFNVAPGPVLVETLRRGLVGGYRPALAVQVGSLVGDVTWAVIGVTGIATVMQLDALRVPLGVAGTIYLLWLAIDAWRSAARADQPREAPTRAGPFVTGALLSLTNVQNVALWSALASVVHVGLGGAHGAAASTCFVAGFMIASVTWCFVCAGLAARAGRLPPWWRMTSMRLCAASLAGLAAASARDLARGPGAPAVDTGSHPHLRTAHP